MFLRFVPNFPSNLYFVKISSNEVRESQCFPAENARIVWLVICLSFVHGSGWKTSHGEVPRKLKFSRKKFHKENYPKKTQKLRVYYLSIDLVEKLRQSQTFQTQFLSQKKRSTNPDCVHYYKENQITKFARVVPKVFVEESKFAGKSFTEFARVIPQVFVQRTTFSGKEFRKENVRTVVAFSF